MLVFFFPALPQYTTASAITQYIFSDSNMAELECPLPLGRLHGRISPYDFSWSVRVVGDPNLLPIAVPINRPFVNGSVGIFHFKDSLNRQLQVHIPSPVQGANYSFRCDGQIQRCNQTGNPACTTRTTESPFITMEFVGEQIHDSFAYLNCMSTYSSVNPEPCMGIARSSLASVTHSPLLFYNAECIWSRGKGLATLAR